MNPNAPRVALRYTASDSTTRHDMHIQPYSVPDPKGGEVDLLRLTHRIDLPSSAGELRLVSNDPHAPPEVHMHLLDDPWDIKRLREAARLCLQLLEHPSFKQLVARRISPTEQEVALDEGLDRWMLEKVGSAHHPAGTCKMGPATDDMAVVDQYCRVHGLQGLRVVDASVMPFIVRSNTHCTTIMIAERVADWVKG